MATPSPDRHSPGNAEAPNSEHPDQELNCLIADALLWLLNNPEPKKSSPGEQRAEQHRTHR
jgi:hypothetical protein